MKKFQPVVYDGGEYLFLERNKDNDVKLFQRKIDKDTQFTIEDKTIIVKLSSIVVCNMDFPYSSGFPLARVIDYVKSGKRFGYTERKKNYINSIGRIKRIRYDGEESNSIKLIMGTSDFSDNILMDLSEVELVGYSASDRLRMRFTKGDLIEIKRDNRFLSLLKGEEFVVEDINDDQEKDFYGTIVIKRINTGKNEIPIIVFPNDFKRIKHNI